MLVTWEDGCDESKSQGRVLDELVESEWVRGGLFGVADESMDGVRLGCEMSVVSEQRAAMSGTSKSWLRSRNCCKLRSPPDFRLRALLAPPVVGPSSCPVPSKVSCELSSPWAGKVGVVAMDGQLVLHENLPSLLMLKKEWIHQSGHEAWKMPAASLQSKVHSFQ